MEKIHTNGPWRIGKAGTVVSDSPTPEINGSDCVDFYGGHLVCESVSEANASRIVACFNACEGITTEELVDIAKTGGMLGPREDIARIARQRDELAESLKKISSFTWSGFVGPYEMALECVSVAKEAVAKLNKDEA